MFPWTCVCRVLLDCPAVRLCIHHTNIVSIVSHKLQQLGKSGTVLEWNQASGVRKVYYSMFYVLFYARKNSILLAVTGIRKISSVA